MCAFSASRWLASCLPAILLLVATDIDASGRQYLKKNEQFCASDRSLCLYGTISFEPNPRIIELRSRIQKQSGPGTLRLDFTGQSRQGDYRRTEAVLDVRGRASEIVNHRFRPDAPDALSWKLVAMTFTPASD